MKGYIRRTNEDFITVIPYPEEGTLQVEIIEIGKCQQSFRTFYLQSNDSKLHHASVNCFWNKDEIGVLITFKKIPGLFSSIGDKTRIFDGMVFPCEGLERITLPFDLEEVENLLSQETRDYFKSET